MNFLPIRDVEKSKVISMQLHWFWNERMSCWDYAESGGGTNLDKKSFKMSFDLVVII